MNERESANRQFKSAMQELIDVVARLIAKQHLYRRAAETIDSDDAKLPAAANDNAPAKVVPTKPRSRYKSKPER